TASADAGRVTDAPGGVNPLPRRGPPGSTAMLANPPQAPPICQSLQHAGHAGRPAGSRCAMSDKPEIELDLDLQLLPAWARQPQTTHQYADFETGGDRDRRGPRGRGPGGPRRDAGDRRGEGRGPRPEGRGFRGDDRGRPRGDRGRRPDAPRREPQEELPEGVSVELIPDPEGVDSLTRQIRQTGRAYPLFDIGHLILKRPDRYLLEFKVTGNHPDGSPRQLYVCSLDDTLWMNEGEAVRHILARHFDTFYQ